MWYKCLKEKKIYTAADLLKIRKKESSNIAHWTSHRNKQQSIE